MNKFENEFFGFFTTMFGENVSRGVYNIYCDLLHDVKLMGIYLSYPFMFFKFFKEAYNERSK